MRPNFNYVIEPLSVIHNRLDFDCGIESLNRYLSQQANQDLKRFLTTVFVLENKNNKEIAGYYTLAATAIKLEQLPTKITQKLPKYPLIPATLLGRLAVSKKYQGQGLGSFLLLDSLQRNLNNEIASMAVIVDAKDDKAKAFYEYHQFVSFPSNPYQLYLPMSTIVKMFKPKNN